MSAPSDRDPRGESTVAALLAAGRRRLAAAPLEPPAREARLLLARTLGVPEVRLLSHPEAAVPDAAAAAYRALLDRRCAGEPVAYLLGEREFWGRAFHVDRRVLIPRPETEHLVEAALAAALPAGPRVLDVGTGSGCLAVTLALDLPGARVAATDRSPGALAVAAANARRLGAAVRLAAADLTEGIDLADFDLVVSNPPYIDPAAPALSREIVDHEPHRALFAGDAGLELIVRLLAQLVRLRAGALVLLEIGRGQAEAVAAAAAGGFAVEAVGRDLAGVRRVVSLRRR